MSAARDEFQGKFSGLGVRFKQCCHYVDARPSRSHRRGR
jgi:hypothetical protein